MALHRILHIDHQSEKTNPILAASLILIGTALTIMIALAMPESGGIDFEIYYRAGQAILHLQMPHTVAGFYNPPWLAVLFVPLALMPIQLAWRVYLVVSMIGIVIALIRLHVPPFGILALALSPWLLLNLYYSNIDWLLLLAAALPPKAAVWLLCVKPQVGGGLLLLLGVRAWKSGGFVELLRFFGPVSIALLFTVAFGLFNPPVSDLYDVSADIFPAGIPLGIFLITHAIRRDDNLLALAATPFMAPYLSISSWISTAATMHHARWWCIIIVPVSWLLVYTWRNLVLMQ